MRWAWAACVLVGCGRYAFQAHDDAAGSGTSDAPHDGSAADAKGDATSDAFDQAAACAPYAVCDSFESNSLAIVWMPGMNVSLDTTRGHRGSHSIHATTSALTSGQSAYSQLGEAKTLSAATPPTTFYVRGWFYLSALPAGVNRMELISIEPVNAAPNADYTFVHSDDTVLYSQADGQTMGPGVPPPVNTWFCIAMRVTRATTATGVLSLTSDVVPATSIPAAVTDSTSTPIKNVWLGIGFAGTNVNQAQPALDLWIDDVIVDPNPVTCAD